MKPTFWQTDPHNIGIYTAYRRYLAQEQRLAEPMERTDRLVEQGKDTWNWRQLTRSHVAGDMLRTSKSCLANGALVVASHDVYEDIGKAGKDDGLVLGGYLIRD